jgi:single-strand DNA-binding protein
MNIVHLIGFVGRDPAIRSFPDGDRVANLTLATSKPRRQAAGGFETVTEWHRIRFYGPATGGLVDRISRFVKKGARIAVIGELTTSSQINGQGERIYSTYIDVRRPDGLELLDRPKTNESAERGEAKPSETKTTETTERHAGQSTHHVEDDTPLSDAMLDAGYDGEDPPF